LAWLYSMELPLSYLTRNYCDLEEVKMQVNTTELGLVGCYSVHRVYFYAGLTLLATYNEVSETEQREHLEVLEEYQTKLKGLSNHCEETFLHKYLLVEAEKMRVLGSDLEDTMVSYTQAIQFAHDNDMLLDEAIANELYGEFWLGRGQDKLAYVFLSEARYAYENWGGKAKVRQLDRIYPKLSTVSSTGSDQQSRPNLHEPTASSIVVDIGASFLLDTNTVIKASRAIAVEIVLEKLLAQMMQIVIENAGAQRGYLIFEKEGKWTIEAEGNIDRSKVQVLQSTSVEASGMVSTGIVHYVARTLENIILNDAANEGDFTSDQTIRQHQCEASGYSPPQHQTVL